jgi:lipopolysaccharide transport system ATP-binding protein
VDEVLAVGDAAFQRKCLRRMGDVAEEGRTVLFVSHNLTAVQGLCGRAIRLHDGRLVDEGPPAAVVAHYLQEAGATLSQQLWPEPTTAPGNDRVRLRRVSVRPEGGRLSDPITTRTPVVLEFEYWNLRPGAHLSLAFHLYNEEGVLVFASAPVSERAEAARPLARGLFRDVCHIPADLLNDALHRVELLVIEHATELVYRQRDAVIFEVHDTPDLRGAWFGKWQGAVRPILRWSTEPVEDAMSAPPS